MRPSLSLWSAHVTIVASSGAGSVCSDYSPSNLARATRPAALHYSTLHTLMSQVLAKLEASIEAQQKKLAQLKAHKQKIEARQKSKLQGAARQQDTRRKVLAGAMLLELMNMDAELQRSMLGKLSAFLTRDDDRKLFGLTVSSKSEQSTG